MSLLTVTETAERLGVTRQRVAALIAEGKLRGCVRTRDRGHRALWLVPSTEVAARQADLDKPVRPAGHLDTAEVGALFGRSAETVREWITAGHLPSVERQGRLWVPESAVKAFEPPRRGRPARVSS